MSKLRDESAWQDQAACVGADQSIFFPTLGNNNAKNQEKLKLAIDICKECPVQMECLKSGIESDLEGIWGGHYFSDKTTKRAKTQQALGFLLERGRKAKFNQRHSKAA